MATVVGLNSGYINPRLDQLPICSGFMPVVQCSLAGNALLALLQLPRRGRRGARPRSIKMPRLSLNTGAGVVRLKTIDGPDSGCPHRSAW